MGSPFLLSKKCDALLELILLCSMGSISQSAKALFGRANTEVHRTSWLLNALKRLSVVPMQRSTGPLGTRLAYSNISIIFSLAEYPFLLSKKCDALLEAYGKQEGRAFNFHFQSNVYYPLVCYDGITGDLIKILLRDGTRYSCTGVVDFLQPIWDEYLVDELDDITRENKVDYALVYGEFMYQAASWPYERRVVCKVEKPENQMTYIYTFIVTNMDSS